MRASALPLLLLLSPAATAAEDAPKGEPPKDAAPKDEGPKGEAAKDEAPKGDAPKDAAPKPDAVAPTDAPKVDAAPAAVVDCPKGTLFCFKNDVVALWPKLRVRPGFEYVDADPQILYIGENDGFFLDQARLGAEGNVNNLVHFKLTVDAASLLPGGQPNQPVNPLIAAARDAWVAWTPSPWIIVQAGQQYMPADYESGDVEAAIPFTRRSVLSAGVRPGEGNAVVGLSPQRQVGLVVGSADDLHVAPDIPLDYRLGISNGNGLNTLGNDNKLPAAYLRVGSGYSDLVRVGVGGRFNPRTVGTLPNLYTESDIVGFVDASVAVAGLRAGGEVIGRETSFTTLVPDGTNPAGSESALGDALWIGYRLDLTDTYGVAITPAFRTAYYDPSSSFQTDGLVENTIGVRIDGDAARVPLTFMIDYTILTEIGDIASNVAVRDIADNRLVALFQLEL